VEGIHFRLGAHGDAHIRRQNGPDASDIHVAFLAIRGPMTSLAWRLASTTEKIRLGGNVRIAFAGEPIKVFWRMAVFNCLRPRNEGARASSWRAAATAVIGKAAPAIVGLQFLE